jgi:cyclic 2,3-diphosphoglycerate synthetase
MRRAIVLIDGEHYPPVVRAALEALSAEYVVAAGVFLGGAEKVGSGGQPDTYGIELVHGESATAALAEAIARFAPEIAIDLSDEPVVSSADRFALATVSLERGVAYRGADFEFAPWDETEIASPTLAVIGTGKRVGKTAVSAHLARVLMAADIDPVVVAMGRGGPPEPELIRGDQVRLTTADLLTLAEQGRHAASDSYEDAVMSRVTTVGCRRCGGGMAGATFVSNVAEGAKLADGLGKDVVVLEGSGAAIPPVRADATLLVVGGAQGVSIVRDYFGPFRVQRADAVVIASAEPPLTAPEDVAAIAAVIETVKPGVPVIPVAFRPVPLEPIDGARVFYATTAPPEALELLTRWLEAEHGCEVVAVSGALSDRAQLRADLEAAAGRYDVIVTELKAAAIDVVAASGAEGGVPVVLCDNVPAALDGQDLDAALLALARTALERGGKRRDERTVRDGSE